MKTKSLILVLVAFTLIAAGLFIWIGETSECGYAVRVPGGIEIYP